MEPAFLTEARADGFGTPPPRRVDGPLVDIHTHTWRGRPTGELLQAAKLYGVTKLLVLTHLEDGLELLKTYPETIEIAVMLDWEVAGDPDPQAFARRNISILRRAHEAGIRVVKFFLAPRARDFFGGHVGDPRLDPVFDTIAELGMSVLIHIGDPDIWFEEKYADVERYGTKADQYPPFEDRLARWRSIKFLAAHLGGDPEHFDHLRELLARHSNLYLDTAAAKWMVRELSRRREAAREFIVEQSDRLLFGTDQVVFDQEKAEKDRYRMRYWAYRILLETDWECDSPIADPDAGGTARLRGLDLPPDVLRKLYRENAARIFGIQPGGGGEGRDRACGPLQTET